MIKKILLTTANILEKPFKMGKVINNRYKIIEFLGRGSYGNSYLVFDRIQQKQAVLKLLRMHKRMFRAGKTAFEQEQELLQSLHHPFFPAFYEKGDYHGTPFFIMEYVSGKTFEQLIFQEGKTYSEEEAFQIGHQLLQIMEWLHKKGIVHRDIRIPNVMLARDQLRLIDFGLARRFEEKNRLPFKLEYLELDSIKKAMAPISDFYALGHFLLFLMYSTYEPAQNEVEKSWEEELQLSDSARMIIRKLLAIEEPYQSCSDIKQDFLILNE